MIGAIGQNKRRASISYGFDDIRDDLSIAISVHHERSVDVVDRKIEGILWHLEISVPQRAEREPALRPRGRLD